MTVSLTLKQAELLAFLVAYREEHDGLAPNFEEMRCAVGLASRSGVHRLLTALEERCHIRRLQHRARAIEILEPNYPAPPHGQIADAICHAAMTAGLVSDAVPEATRALRIIVMGALR